MPDFTFFDKPYDATMRAATGRDTQHRRNSVQFAVDDLLDALKYLRAEMVRGGESVAWMADALDALNDALPAVEKSLNRERDEHGLPELEPFRRDGIAALIKRVEGR